ncbi:MAG: tRNA (adenosine(37)-N6)-threonylcarbamoyltransferase complex dimerization subunit type 1 TsaB [Micrococcales bacterium]|nr:tRNA (adenosine(37)-N6)-threonylcarbamoyltransferase complex dimerization subunit type 1 TsaB [Micrococcales bacterium]
MPYLALDTSAGLAVAIVGDDGAALARSGDPEPRRHAEQLTPHVAGVLADAGLTARDLTGIVVGTGPAPFTGLRAGLVTARTLGYALDIPVLGVPSLAAVATRALDLVGSDDAQHVVVVTDARRREVYWARYARDADLGVRAVDGPGVCAPGEVPTTGATLAGRAAHLVAGDPLDPEVASELANLDPDPVALVAVALALRSHGEPTPTEPLYLRRPDAVPSTGTKRVLA